MGFVGAHLCAPLRVLIELEIVERVASSARQWFLHYNLCVEGRRISIARRFLANTDNDQRMHKHAR